MSQQSKLASWQQLKAQAAQPKVQTVTTIVEEPTKLEIILTPSIVEQEILVDLIVQSENLEENTTQVANDESIIESTTKKSTKKGTVNV